MAILEESPVDMVFVTNSVPLPEGCKSEKIEQVLWGRGRAGLGWAGLGWAGLGWAGVGLGWVGLGWVGLGWVGVRQHKGGWWC